MANGICEFYVSIAEKSEDGLYSIDKVVPPDEFATGWRYQGVKNSVFTNVGAQLSCEFATRLAKETLSVSKEKLGEWDDFIKNIVILTSPLSGEQTYHPEYEGYPSSNIWSDYKVKQADVTLLGFPLDYQNITREQRLNDLT